MKNIWILVANRMEAKVFECFSLKDELKVIKTLSNPFLTATDKVPHESDAEAFARHLSQVLDCDRSHGRFDALLLAAEPGFLGRLRTHFEKRAAYSGRLRAVNKELTHVSTKNLRLHLSEVLFEMMRVPRGPVERSRHLHLSA